eukprot:gene11522-13616_t
MTYIEIRTLFTPFQLAVMVAQTSFLARKDAWTPLKMVSAAALLNCCGDFIMCSILGQGIAGAAFATICAQMALFGMLLFRLHRQGVLPSLFPATPFETLLPFVRFAGPLSLVSFMRVAAFTFINFTVASLGTTALAAHQIILSVFIFLVIAGEPLGQYAQTALPRYLPGSPDASPSAAFALIKKVLIGEAIIGIITAIIGCATISYAGSIFTSDPAVLAEMKSVVPVMLFSYLLSPISACTDDLISNLIDFETIVGGGVLQECSPQEKTLSICSLFMVWEHLPR